MIFTFMGCLTPNYVDIEEYLSLYNNTICECALIVGWRQ